MALSYPPSVCVWDPILPVSAGTDVVAKINPSSRRCRADLHFEDTKYLPISWTFEPIGCIGQETVALTVPEGVPNGDAYITWDCAGDTALSCVHVKLTNGTSNLDSTAVQQSGVVKCLTESVTTLMTKRSKTSTDETPTSTSSGLQGKDSTGSTILGDFETTSIATPIGTGVPADTSTEVAAITTATRTAPAAPTTPTFTTTVETNGDPGSAPRNGTNPDSPMQTGPTSTSLDEGPNTPVTFFVTTTVQECAPQTHS